MCFLRAVTTGNVTHALQESMHRTGRSLGLSFMRRPSVVAVVVASLMSTVAAVEAQPHSLM
jgi:hypothetical protein